MQIRMDKILREYADQAYETARLGRNGVHPAVTGFQQKMLAELEAAGEAMRYVNPRGQIAWKATPQLRDYLMDLQLDAEADLAEFLTMLGREPTAIPFSAEAMRASLLRLENEWETYQTTQDRDAVYGYLSAVFETRHGVDSGG